MDELIWWNNSIQTTRSKRLNPNDLIQTTQSKRLDPNDSIQTTWSKRLDPNDSIQTTRSQQLDPNDSIQWFLMTHSLITANDLYVREHTIRESKSQPLHWWEVFYHWGESTDDQEVLLVWQDQGPRQQVRAFLSRHLIKPLQVNDISDSPLVWALQFNVLILMWLDKTWPLIWPK